MREILNISLPKEMAEGIRNLAKAEDFSVSELVRAAIRLYKTERLNRIAEGAMKEHREGKTIEIKSFKDLRKYR
ncbi:MAG: ribbon-helix-helix protein, CopG family [Patescibacteria group bacterium]